MGTMGMSYQRTFTLGILTYLGFLTACQQPKTFIPGHTDRFVTHSEDLYAQANQVLQADYVFVLDYSYSMSNGNASQSAKLQELTNAMGDFTLALKSENIDYNIGFIKGNSHAGSSSSISSNFVSPFLTLESSSTGLDSQILEQVSPVGNPLQENTNYLLESALRTMKAQSSAFIRSAAQLVFVFVSDGDDISHKNSRIPGAKTTDYYTEELLKLKSDPAYISGRSFTAGVANDCAIQQVWEEAGTRIAEVAQNIDGTAYEPECVFSPMAQSLDGLARDVTKTTSRFVLRGTPDASSVRIFINGSEVPSSGNWSYQASSNEVVFVSGQEPAPSSQLRIEYHMLYKLSKSPKAGSISVTINGASIAESSSNGWSLNTAENRIEFHGSAVPSQEADVRISYTTL